MLTETQARELAQRIKEALPDWQVEVSYTSPEVVRLFWERVPSLHALPLDTLVDQQVGWFVRGWQGDPTQTGVTIWDHVVPDVDPFRKGS